MSEVQAPPKWQDILKTESEKLPFLLAAPEVSQFLNRTNQQYLHWDKFRYQQMPPNVTPAIGWALLKITRMGNREILPIKNEKHQAFSVFLTKDHLRSISYIDSYASGAIASSDSLPTGNQRDKLIISGLIEEAISSSQIEGANTTRKVAKAMFELNRSPRNTDEQMIYNNYVAMTRLEGWKTRKLDDDFLLELHRVLTSGTMEDPASEGRFRNDADEVVVQDRLTGEIVHTPPTAAEARAQLKQLFAFANTEDDEKYIHPFVKASILHFCLGYIHPFVDGNGRSARALFYWYLIKKNYWMFKFLPISLQIKKKDWRIGYDRAFQYVETDEGDITYFLTYKLKLARNAIEDFIKYLEKKQRDANRLKERLLENAEINQRQLELIELLQKNPNLDVDLKAYKARNKVVYETARTDLLGLTEKGILKQNRIGRRYIFTRGENFPSS